MMKNLFFCCLFIFLNTNLYGQQLTKQQALNDLNYLYEELLKAHANPFLHITKDEFSREKENLTKWIEQSKSLDLNSFSVELMKLTAKLNDAHTQVYWENERIKNNLDSLQLFPYKLVINLDNKLRIDDDGAYSGKNILEINGKDASKLYQECMATQAGTFYFKNYMVGNYFFAVFLYLKGIYPPYRVKLEDGTFTKEINCISLNQISNRFAPTEAPYTFSVLDNDIGYLQYNLCDGYDDFNVFLQNTFQEIKEKSIQKLVIDIRYNFGGNSALNDLLIPYFSRKKYRQSSTRHWKISQAMKERMATPFYQEVFSKSAIKMLTSPENGTVLKEDEYSLTKPKKAKPFYEGKLCVLIGPQTFSSANFLADAIKTYELTTLIGKPTGELTNDFGEVISFEMPNTGLSFSCSIAYDIGADGDSEKVDVVHPDILVEEDALEYAKKWLKEL